VEGGSLQLDTALPVLRLPAVINPKTTNRSRVRRREVDR